MSKKSSHESPVLWELNRIWPDCLPATSDVSVGDVTLAALIVGVAITAMLPALLWVAIPAAIGVAVVAWRAERTELWYAATLGIPIPQAFLLARLSLADLLILPSILRDGPGWLRGRLPRSSLVVPLLLLVAVSAMATVVGYLRLGHWSTWAILNKDAGLILQMATLFALTSRLRTFVDIRRVAQWYVIGVSIGNIGMLIGVLGTFLGVPNPLFHSRLFGWMSQPTITGGLLLVAVMLELGCLSMPPQPAERRVLRWTNVWLLGLSLGLTVSRSTWLSVAAGAATLLAVMALRGRRLAPQPRFAHVGLTAIWLLVPGVFLGNILTFNLTTNVPLVSSDRRTDLRAELVAKCLEHPEQEFCTGPIAPPPGTQGTAPLLTVEELLKAQAEPVGLPGKEALMNGRGLSDRIAILREGWTQYSRDWASMVFGIGLGTFLANSVQDFGLPLIIHNTFAWYLFELGPIGLAIVLWIWLTTARNIWAATKRHEEAAALALGLTAAFGAFAAFCLFNEGFYQRQFWLVMVLADRLAALPTASADQAVSTATAA